VRGERGGTLIVTDCAMDCGIGYGAVVKGASCCVAMAGRGGWFSWRRTDAGGVRLDMGDLAGTATGVRIDRLAHTI
jgi:hypothetical protein